MINKDNNFKLLRTVTYCTWSSIGSVLQAYALSEALKEQRYDSTLWLEDWCGLYKRSKSGGIKSAIKSFYGLLFESRIKKAYTKRISFVEEKLKTEYFQNYDDFRVKAEKENGLVYLAGSDQIWNPQLCRSMFFLDFVPDSCKKITYAVSMGTTEIPDKNLDKFRSLVSAFNHISVREEECVEIIKGITDTEVEVHIDPTFLINRENWQELEKSYRIKDKYILLYMLYWDDSLKRKIKEFKKKTGLKVYAVCQGISKVYADKKLYDVGIEEFLWLIDNAEYVVTSSFHGVAMSIIFNKRFSAVINPTSPSRINNLLNKLSVPVIDIEELSSAEPIDYSVVNSRIKEEQNKSIEYLKRVLE